MNKNINKLNKITNKLKNLSQFEKNERHGTPGKESEYSTSNSKIFTIESYGGSISLIVRDDKIYMSQSSNGEYGICDYTFEKYKEIKNIINEYGSKIGHIVD